MTRLRLSTYVLLSSLLAACGGSSSNPAAPSAPATATSGAVSGFVTQEPGGARLNGVTITMLDGPAAGRTTVTAGSGTFSFANVPVGNMNIGATADGYTGDGKGLSFNGSNGTVNFTVTAPVFKRTGSGNAVFDNGSWVGRVQVEGTFLLTGSSNFIIRCGGSLVVNELLGFGFGTIRYTGTHQLPTRGCSPFEITNSTGVLWTITEVR